MASDTRAPTLFPLASTYLAFIESPRGLVIRVLLLIVWSNVQASIPPTDAPGPKAIQSAQSKQPPLPEHPPALIPPGTSAQLPTPPGAVTREELKTEGLTLMATASIAPPPPQ